MMIFEIKIVGYTKNYLQEKKFFFFTKKKNNFLRICVFFNYLIYYLFDILYVFNL